jgi:hypothetical protein
MEGIDLLMTLLSAAETPEQHERRDHQKLTVASLEQLAVAGAHTLYL